MIVRSATRDAGDAGFFTIFQKQVMAMILGFSLLIVLSRIDYRFFVKYSWIIYILSLLLLLYVAFKGKELNGARRWIEIKKFGTIQPSEFSKIALILVFANILAMMRESINTFRGLMFLLIVAVPTFLLIFKQPDLSTTLVCVFLFSAMVFASGISYRLVLGIIGSATALIIFVVVLALLSDPGKGNFILASHQVERIQSFFHPETHADLMYQQNYSVLAIAGGRILGKGWNNATFDSVKNGNFLSEEQCDFIFAVVGEELGFIGSFLILCLFAYIVYRCLRIAARRKDISGRLIATGYASFLAFQVFVNIAVATRLIPNTGIPLPFISAGMSSILSAFIGLGLVMSVSRFGDA